MYAEKCLSSSMQRNIFLSSMQRNIFFGMQRNIRHERCRLSPWPDTYFTLCRISATMLQRVLRLLYCIHYPLSRPCQRVWFSSGEHFLHLNVKHPSMCVHQMDISSLLLSCVYCVCHTVVSTKWPQLYSVTVHRVTFHSVL